MSPYRVSRVACPVAAIRAGACRGGADHGERGDRRQLRRALQLPVSGDARLRRHGLDGRAVMLLRHRGVIDGLQLVEQRIRLDAVDEALFAAQPRHRSERHTSEIKSLMRLSYAVYCLKKTT